MIAIDPVSFENPKIEYTGQRKDDSRLLYYYARHYDPTDYFA